MALVCLAACTGDESGNEAPVVQLGAPGESGRPLSEDEVRELGGAPAAEPTEADVAFVQNMIPHHQQALVMTAMVTDRTASRDVRLLAQRMDVSQRDEIRQLEGWLVSHGHEASTRHGHHDAQHAELMPGMLTDDELSRLESARGPAFDRLFLQFMIRHHEGAVFMVSELFTDGGGQEPSAFQLAQHIDSDQRVEIARMRTMLAGLQAGSR
ncbi:MAG: DUF305 domain-containing protein [Actinomycetes bacterium]